MQKLLLMILTVVQIFCFIGNEYNSDNIVISKEKINKKNIHLVP